MWKTYIKLWGNRFPSVRAMNRETGWYNVLMTTVLLFLGSAPVVIANLWHQFLILSRKKPHQTISQHATETKNRLFIHRLIHGVSSIALILFAWFYLIEVRYTAAGLVLMVGAAFDILEVMTLNETSARPVFAVNYHAITAWIMALGYILYVITIVNIAGMPASLSWGIVLLFLSLLGLAFIQKFKNFWIIQHVYFCMLAVLIVLAHTQLFLAK